MATIKKAKNGLPKLASDTTKKLTPQQKASVISATKKHYKLNPPLSYSKKQAAAKDSAASAKKSIERDADAKISTISSFGNKFQEMFPKQKMGGKVIKKSSKKK